MHRCPQFFDVSGDKVRAELGLRLLVQRRDELALTIVLGAGPLRQPDQPLETPSSALRDGRFVLYHASRSVGRAIRRRSVPFPNEMDRERAARHEALHRLNVLELVHRQSLVRQDGVAEALQLAFEELPLRLPIVATFREIDRGFARRPRIVGFFAVAAGAWAAPSTCNALSSCAMSCASRPTFRL